MKGARRTGSTARARVTAWLTVSNAWRGPLLGANIALGRLRGITRRGWWPFLSTLALVLAILILGPILLSQAEKTLKAIGVKGVDPAPEVGDWLSLLNIVLLMIGVLFVRWISRARNRVVVEGFVDFTKDNATAVSGLSTLLVTELGRLRDLYNQADDLSVPTAVGVEQHGGFGRGKEAATFLTVSADDVTDVLEGAVASDARIEMGPAKIPVGPILAFFNRLTRGPRVTGSVHLTEAGGGPTLTAQLVGKDSSGTWRVDQPREPESPEQRRAFLDSMVRELACRMFTQLTLRGSVRWQAVKEFNEYLRLYGGSRRTPRDRARLLKQAQARLLAAVAEDERFDLAYYNLGVIYTQLAQTERLAEQQSDDATSRAKFQRKELDAARREAARVAFLRAAAKKPDRWQPYYAQAVTRFSQIGESKLGDVEIDKELDPEDPRRADLHAVVALCEQTLAVAPGKDATAGAVYDLRGMAQIRLGDFAAAVASHHKAARHSWMEYCRANRRDRARPAGQPELTERARTNATAALHNLALAYERRALTGGGIKGFDRYDLWTARRIFRKAGRLAGAGNEVTAACHFELGRALERAGQFGPAAREFRRAGRVSSRSCEYRACRARALAMEARTLALARRRDKKKIAEVREQATWAAARALDLLAKPFSLAVTPGTARAIDLECEATLTALEEAHEALDDKSEAKRMRAIGELGPILEDALREAESASTGGDYPHMENLRERARQLREQRRREWELDQAQLALGRSCAEAQSWEEASETLDDLLRRLSSEEKRELDDRIIEFGLYAHLSRAQRECHNYVLALRTAAEGVRRDPLNVEGRREAGRAHFALGQYSDALAAWEDALWLSPSDPYLHYEVAMCHRRMWQERTDETERQRFLTGAESHFAQAQELFDGEDLDGEAWTRFWRGKLALEAKKPVEAIAFLRGAEHGTATAAAALLLGEAYLELEQRPAADHAFKRCETALKADKTAELEGRDTIDALWGDELPVAAVWARILRGSAEAKFLTQGAWQDSAMASRAMKLLARARRRLRTLADDAARDEAMTRVLATESRVLAATGKIDLALDRAHQRLRYESTPEAQLLQAELLDLRAKSGKRVRRAARIRIAADSALQTARSNGQLPGEPRRQPQPN